MSVMWSPSDSTRTHRALQQLRHSLWLQQISLLGLWLFVFELGWLVEYTQHASVWFPVAGLSFAAFFVFGWTALPGLVLGCVLITYYTAIHYQIPLPWLDLTLAGVMFGFAHLMPYALGAFALRYLCQWRQRELPLTILCFLLIAALSSLLASSLVLPTLVNAGMMPPEAMATAWLPFWIGDMAGVMVVAPFFIGLLSLISPASLMRLTDVRSWQSPQVTPYLLAKLGIILLFLSAAMGLAAWQPGPNSAYAIFFLVIPHMWLACSESPLWNTFGVALSAFAIALWVHVLGLMDWVMVYQFAICVIAANSLFGLSIPTLLADNRQLRIVASRDSLTHAASRERTEQQANEEMEVASVQQTPLTLLAIDVDHFKQINDQHGHAVGDQALMELCRSIRLCLRAGDTLGRFGGDEFMVILPETSIAQASAVVQRLQRLLQDVVMPDSVPLTVSIGIALWQPSDSFSTWLERADRALYLAKRQGRNQFAVAD